MDYLIAAEMFEVQQNPMKALNSLITRGNLSETVPDEVIAADTTKYRNPLDKVCFELRNSCLRDDYALPDSPRLSTDDGSVIDDYTSSSTLVKPSAVAKLSGHSNSRDIQETVLASDTLDEGERVSQRKDEKRRKPRSQDFITDAVCDLNVPETSRTRSAQSSRGGESRYKALHTPSDKSRGPASHDEDSTETLRQLSSVLKDSDVINPGKKMTRQVENLTKTDDVIEENKSRGRTQRSLGEGQTLAPAKRGLTVTKSNEENCEEGGVTSSRTPRNILKGLLRSPFTKRQKGILDALKGEKVSN